MKCIDCFFYKGSFQEGLDQCTHVKAQSVTGGIRAEPKITYYYCSTMLDSLCQNHCLFQSKFPPLEAA